MLIYSSHVGQELWTMNHELTVSVLYLACTYIWCKIFNRLAWIWLSEFLKVPIYQYICLTFCDGLDLVKATFRQDTQSNVIRLQHRLVKKKYVMKMEPKLNLLQWYILEVFTVCERTTKYMYISSCHINGTVDWENMQQQSYIRTILSIMYIL